MLPNLSVSLAGPSAVARVWILGLKVGKPEAAYRRRCKTPKTDTDVGEILNRNLAQPAKLNTAARDFALKGSVGYYTLFKD